MDLEQLLLRRGEKLLPSGREKRLGSNHSVTIRGNTWFDHAAERGGLAIDFLRFMDGLSFPEAVSALLGGEFPRAAEQGSPLQKEFALPPANGDMRRTFAYLCKERGISDWVLSDFAHRKLLYEDTPYHNAVFVGLDEEGLPRHAHKRSTGGKTFRINVEGGDARYSFHWIGQGKNLYVFEAPIDLLSYITLHPQDWQEQSYVALCGLSARPIHHLLEIYPQLTEVTLCLDNDPAGRRAAERIQQELEQAGYPVESDFSNDKDWNQDLVGFAY